jgi:cytochrome c-type biogenesis protein CcmH/NrfF
MQSRAQERTDELGDESSPSQTCSKRRKMATELRCAVLRLRSINDRQAAMRIGLRRRVASNAGPRFVNWP